MNYQSGNFRGKKGRTSFGWVDNIQGERASRGFLGKFGGESLRKDSEMERIDGKYGRLKEK